MDIRYSANQKDARYYDSEELREEFLIQKLYEADKVHAVYSHVDRMVVFGCMPVKGSVTLDREISSARTMSSRDGRWGSSKSEETERSARTA